MSSIVAGLHMNSVRGLSAAALAMMFCTGESSPQSWLPLGQDKLQLWLKLAEVRPTI